MATIPPAYPSTVPDNEPTEASAGALLAHTPPGVASVIVVGIPVQILPGPETGSGTGSTVIDLVSWHPAPVI